ncbi:MAG: hypothetical protein ACK514_08255 [Bacteroidota bacterium]|jgi:hypothetical protein|nr:hypothetical protein [Cytophagales bacterium]MCA6428751.1 hypothetical protein [Cytophagales bacterium]
MKARGLFFLSAYLVYQFGFGQNNILEKCGVDSRFELNQYEIRVVDSLFIPSFKTKKSQTVDPKNGFDLNGKKIAFYSCTKNSNTKGNGLMSKSEFFGLCRPDFKGHAGRGIIVFNEKEKAESNGFDALIIIDCPYYPLKTNAVIVKLLEKYK